MKERHSPARREATVDWLEAEMVKHLLKGWIMDDEIEHRSPATIKNHRNAVEKLLWWLDQNGHTTCGPDEVKGFFYYLATAHLKPAGRWNGRSDPKGRYPRRGQDPLQASTSKNYHAILKTFFERAEQDGLLDESPMVRIKAPIVRADQIVPFDASQIEALLKAAGKTRQTLRDRAIILCLYDTGMRAAELCGLLVRDIDFDSRSATVRGKGGKQRNVPLGQKLRRALWIHLGHGHRDPASPLFFAMRGKGRGEALTVGGLELLVRRLGKAAGISGVRCSPHTFRHSFAIRWIRAGGDQFSLQQILGHTDLSMTSRYVMLAQADVAAQHAKFSPADALEERGR